jgi:hypothetical protein
MQSWLLLSYTLQAEPSSKRVQVWRQLRKAGAILESGVWLLPETPDTRRLIEGLRQSIRDFGGSAIAFKAEDLSEDQKQALQATYDAERRTEYQELLSRCERFISHAERLTREQEFKFGAVEELEEDLEKRRRTLAQIGARDVFQVEERKAVEDSIARCEAALAVFVERAFLAG